MLTRVDRTQRHADEHHEVAATIAADLDGFDGLAAADFRNLSERPGD